MTELSRSNIQEIPRNATDDPLAIRELTFCCTTETSDAQRFDLDKPMRQSDVGRKITLKDPDDVFNAAKNEIKEITKVDGKTIELDSALSQTYPVGSFLYFVKETDILDTAITDRTPTNYQMIETSESVDPDN